MTRINLIDPKLLSRQHLVAEYREIMRLPSNLLQSLNRKGKPFSLKEIPAKYVLGPGHVKFFFDKMLFLQKRFELLVAEMQRRGYTTNYADSSIFVPEDKRFYNDYVPSEREVEVNLKRIKERS